MPTRHASLRIPGTTRRPDELPNVGTDDGLRHAVRDSASSAWWDTPPGRNLLAEIRRRAGRNAAHIASNTETSNGRDLVDDIVTAAWLVLHKNGDKVAIATRPWAYVMSSAQRQVLAEVRAQQLLTSAASIRGRARNVLPRAINPVGSTATDLAIALRHEPHGTVDDIAGHPDITCQVRGREEPPLLDETTIPSMRTRNRPPWLTALIDLLADHGADRTTTSTAIDRLADLFSATSAGWWEWAARRDPILARLNLSPDQTGSLVALLAGSRADRHNGRHDSLLHTMRSHLNHGASTQLTAIQQRRIATYTSAGRQLSRQEGPPRLPGLRRRGGAGTVSSPD